MELPLTEFEPLTSVIHAIPRKTQRGLFTSWVNWTCIDVTREYIAVGSDAGVVFLLDRATNDVKRLFCKLHKNEVIVTVKLCHSVDYVLAAGTVKGSVYIFQLPSILPGRPRELRQFLVPTMHHSSVKALTWSQNAMKLYTGDEDGAIACTELSYDTGECKAYLVCKEPHEVVQLDYMYRILLVSTRFRCLLCFTDDNNRIQQIGTKDRKTLGRFGATFVPGIVQASDGIVFTVRPGLRVWRAGTDGVVKATLLFRDILTASGPAPADPAHAMDMLDDTAQPPNTKHGDGEEDKQFGQLLIYEGTQLVTWHGAALYVLEPGTGSAPAYHRALGTVLGVAVSDDEIFVLRDHRSRAIVRIAKKPDLKLSPQANAVSLAMPSISPSITGAVPVQLLQDTASQMSQSLATVFNQVSEKIQAVQEGERTPASPPPWGYHAHSQDSIENPDSAKESPSTSQPPSQPLSPQDSHASIVSPPPTAEPSTEPSTESTTEPQPKAPGLASQAHQVEVAAAEAVKVKPAAKPARKHKKKEKVVDLDNSQEPLVVHKKVKKKKKAADAGSVSSLELNQGSPLPGSPALAHKVLDKEGGVQAGVVSVDDDLAPVVAENPKWTKMLEKLEQELTRLPSGSGVEHPENPEKAKATDGLEKDPQDSGLVREAGSVETDLSLVSVSQAVSKDSFVITDAASSSSSLTGMGNEGKPVGKPVGKNASPPKGFPVPVPKSPQNDSEDFYSRYKTFTPGSPESVSIEDALEASAEEREPEKEEKSSMEREAADASNFSGTDWLEFVLPSSIQGLCVNERHVWIVDNAKKVYYSHLLGPGLKWEEVKGVSGEQVCTSPSGSIVWRLHKGSLHAATGVKARHPAGSKWVEVARGVRHAALDESVGWYCKTSGEVFIHKNLSRERPLYRSQAVPYDAGAGGGTGGGAVSCVSAYGGVVWALGGGGAGGRTRELLVRTGVTARMPEGVAWEPIRGCPEELLVAAMELGTQQTGWVVDVVGRLWFTIGVTPAKPHGSGQWWQVSLSEFLMEDGLALKKLGSALAAPASLATLLQRTDSGGLLSARVNGLWFSSSYNKNILLACKMGLVGHRWDVSSLKGLVTSLKWHSVMVDAAHEATGLVWAQQPNASLFVFSLDKLEPREISPPFDPRQPHQVPKPFKVMSGGREAVWGLMEGGEVYIRAEMTSHCPQGVKWTRLDLSQLGAGVRFGWLSCGGQNVWAVAGGGGSRAGAVYLRIGVLPPAQAHLNPVWVPVEGTTNSSGAKFVKVYAGSNDWMVWAMDSKGAVYARKGITDSFPLGTEWVFVPGPPAESLAVSERLVYAVTAANGELLVRHGISREHPDGSHWKKIPGVMQNISVTGGTDELWGLNADQQLCRRSTHVLALKPVLDTLRGTMARGQSVDEGWEML